MKTPSNDIVTENHRELFTDGKLSAEGPLRDGKRNGKWKFYYRNGLLKATGELLDGELEGYWEWWRENGQLLQAGAFHKGVQTGP